MSKIKKNIKPTAKNDFFDYKKYKWLVLLGIFTMSFLLYANTLSHEYAVDDMIVTTDNPLVQKGFDGIGELLTHGYFFANTGRNDESYRPLSMVMIAIETEFFGLNPSVNHFFNVLFYSLTSVLLFLLLKLVFRRENIAIPLAITILFLSHPIHTEVVANVKSRDEIMQLFFSITTLLLLLSSIFSEKNKVLQLVGSVLSYFLALMSKEIAITFLAVIPLLLYFFSDLKIKKILLYTSPFFAMFFVYMLLRISILENIAIDKEITVYQNTLFGTSGIGEFLATNMTIHLKYLQLLIFPHPLSWDYSFNQIPIVDFFNAKAIFSVLIFSMLGAYAVYGLIKKNPISFSIFYYLITISVVSNFVVKIAATMGERFIYTASLGFAIFIVLVFAEIFKRIKTSEFNKTLAVFTLIGIVTLLFSYKTVMRNKDWKNNFTIYEAGVKASPNSARTHIALADTYRIKFAESKTEIEKIVFWQKAVDGYEKALQIYPENPTTYYSYGYLYYISGEKDKALEKFLKGTSYDSTHVDMLNYLGIIYTEKQNFENGEEYFLKVLDYKPDYIHALNNLAFVYTQKKQYEKSIELYKKVIELGKATEKTHTEIERLEKIIQQDY